MITHAPVSVWEVCVQAVALGAKAVIVGRPAAWGLAVNVKQKPHHT